MPSTTDLGVGSRWVKVGSGRCRNGSPGCPRLPDPRLVGTLISLARFCKMIEAGAKCANLHASYMDGCDRRWERRPRRLGRRPRMSRTASRTIANMVRGRSKSGRVHPAPGFRMRLILKAKAGGEGPARRRPAAGPPVRPPLSPPNSGPPAPSKNSTAFS